MTWVWTAQVHLYVGFLKKLCSQTSICLGFCIHRFNQLQIKTLVGNLQMWRTESIHYYTSVYVKDLSICRFWYLQGVLELMSRRYKGMIVVTILGNQTLYVHFWLCRDQCPKPQHCSRVNCNYRNMVSLLRTYSLNVRANKMFQVSIIGLGRAKGSLRFYVTPWDLDQTKLTLIKPRFNPRVCR